VSAPSNCYRCGAEPLVSSGDGVGFVSISTEEPPLLAPRRSGVHRAGHHPPDVTRAGTELWPGPAGALQSAVARAYELGKSVGAAEEREACAVIAETCSGGDHELSKRDLIAQRIRARGRS
jgi:hypothetical protein